MGRAIFISYRRDDSEGEAGRLFDDLVRAFGDDSVFMDVAGINPGSDFRTAIDDNVATCGVLLAVIGPHWVSVTDRSGQRRLDNENDFVRLETASALARKIPVIPVLVHEAKMPAPEELPDNLKDLAYRNSVEITHARWNSDVALLTQALKQYVGSSSATATAPVHATVPVQLPPPNAAAPPAALEKSSKGPLIAGIVLAGILVIAAISFFALHHAAGTPAGSTSLSPQPVTQAAAPPAAQSTSPAATQPAAAAAPPVTASMSEAAPAPATQPAAGAAESLAAGAEASTPAPEAPLTGTWVNAQRMVGNSLIRLQFTSAGDHLIIHGWGACDGCDWGTRVASFNGQQAMAVFQFPQPMGDSPAGRIAMVTAALGGPELNVTILNTFPGVGQTVRRSVFVRSQ